MASKARQSATSPRLAAGSATYRPSPHPAASRSAACAPAAVAQTAPQPTTAAANRNAAQPRPPDRNRPPPATGIVNPPRSVNRRPAGRGLSAQVIQTNEKQVTFIHDCSLSRRKGRKPAYNPVSILLPHKRLRHPQAVGLVTEKHYKHPRCNRCPEQVGYQPLTC